MFSNTDKFNKDYDNIIEKECIFKSDEMEGKI
jgi:hypothetical protein